VITPSFTTSVRVASAVSSIRELSSVRIPVTLLIRPDGVISLTPATIIL